MTRADGAAPAAGGFALSTDGTRWIYTGALTFDNAATVVEATRELSLPRSGRVDLAALEPADSSALAALFALKRRAHAERKHLVFESIPPGLLSLANVYGVESLLAGH
jgi:phospholipid transport system transporter-binding protein